MPVGAVDPNTAGGASPPSPEVYRVSGDTLNSIAADHGVSREALRQANPQVLHPDLSRPGQAIHIPGAGSDHPAAAQVDYTVKSGDTLSQIAQKFGVDWKVMAAINGVRDTHSLKPGTVPHIDGVGRNGGPPVAPKPAASPRPASPRPQPATGLGLPRTEGLSQAQTYSLYAKYVNTYGDAQARSDLAAGKQVILGLRHDTNTHANGGRGVYDDRIVVLGGGKAHEYGANTDR